MLSAFFVSSEKTQKEIDQQFADFRKQYEKELKEYYKDTNFLRNDIDFDQRISDAEEKLENK